MKTTAFINQVLRNTPGIPPPPTLLSKGPETWAWIPGDIRSSKIKRWRPVGCLCRLCCEYITILGLIWSYFYSLCTSYGENDILWVCFVLLFTFYC